MKITKKWLQKFLEGSYDWNAVVARLDNIGFEVEEIVDSAAIYSDFIMAHVRSVSPHPDANKLNVCQVFDGQDELQIVCGAANVRAGLNIVLAPIGSVIPQSQLRIKKSKIRGVESNGMICSAEELGLEESSEGIMEILDKDVQPGTKFTEYFAKNDVMIDLAITPNRPDAISVYGIARDLAACGYGALSIPQYKKLGIELQDSGNHKLIGDVIKDDCYELSLVEIRGVQNKARAEGVSELLEAIGSSNISAIVDISNYAMYSLGRPNHAYDADKVQGKISVRKALKGEKFIALNDEEYELDETMTVVADEEKVLGLAGVIGGQSSKVDEHTKNIIVEVANFTPESVINTARKLNIITESRYRFERTVDYGNTQEFMNFLCALIVEHAGGQVQSVDYKFNAKPSFIETIQYDKERFDRITGLDIAIAEIDSILQKLQFKIKGDVIHIPSFRQGDMQSMADIAEEVIRIKGSDCITPKRMEQPAPNLKKDLSTSLDSLRNSLLGKGYMEQITWSFNTLDNNKVIGYEQSYEILNPISLEMNAMRSSMLPNLLDIAKNNLNRGMKNIALFEIGKIFPVTSESAGSRDSETCDQYVLSMVRIGDISEKGVHSEAKSSSVFHIKADAEHIIEFMGFDFSKLNYDRENIPSYLHPGESTALSIGKQEVAILGRLHPQTLKQFDLAGEDVFFAQINLHRLPIKFEHKANKKIEISEYQSSHRDFCFLLDSKIAAEEVRREIARTDKNLIKEVKVFDEYQMSDTQKSLAFKVILCSNEQTLSDDIINDVSQKIVDNVSKKFEAKLK